MAEHIFTEGEKKCMEAYREYILFDLMLTDEMMRIGIIEYTSYEEISYWLDKAWESISVAPCSTHNAKICCLLNAYSR